MAEKEVTCLAGIGKAYGRRLADQGYDLAFVVLGQFLLLLKDRDLFVEWLRVALNVNRNCGNACFSCLSEWCERHL